MRRYSPIFFSLMVVVLAFVFVYYLKHSSVSSTMKPFSIGGFKHQQKCSRQPPFLRRLKISQPIVIDLSQERYRGIAFRFGRGLSQVLHPSAWEKFDHFSSYIIDPKGNIYLTPMPYISVKSNTFDLQKNIYKLDGKSGRLSIWISIDEVRAGSFNPYGVIAIAYDCDDDTLWVAAIDESDYHTQRGVIYHIDIQQQKILQRVEGIDALSLLLLQTDQGKYLLVGSARKNHLYALRIREGRLSSTPQRLLLLPDPNEHIRKIIVRGENHLEIQTIPFAYTLVAQTAEEGVRSTYDVYLHSSTSQWELSLKK